LGVSKEQSFLKCWCQLFCYILFTFYFTTRRVSKGYHGTQKRDELSFIPASLMPSGQGISEINPGDHPTAPSQTAGDFYC